MNHHIRTSAIALALAFMPAAAFAQTTTITTTTTETRPVVLSPEQRTVIYRTVTKERHVVPAPPPTVTYEVGAPLPPSVEAYDFPEDVYIDVPTLRRYRYVYVNNRIVLVDPATSRVVDVISE